jgi:hypothetical protein
MVSFRASFVRIAILVRAISVSQAFLPRQLQPHFIRSDSVCTHATNEKLIKQSMATKPIIELLVDEDDHDHDNPYDPTYAQRVAKVLHQQFHLYNVKNSQCACAG